MNADGTGLRRLTNNPGTLAPHWSPDGRQIVYSHHDLPNFRSYLSKLTVSFFATSNSMNVSTNSTPWNFAAAIIQRSDRSRYEQSSKGKLWCEIENYCPSFGTVAGGVMKV